MNRLKIPVHIEASVLPSCNTVSYADLEVEIKAALETACPVFCNGYLPVPKALQHAIQALHVVDLAKDQRISHWQADLRVHLFRYHEQGPDMDYLEGEEDIAAAEQWELPNTYFKGLWESIVVDEGIKSKLTNYCCSSILFADAQVDGNLINWNKMVLLHGPPGTGKTSLCKALAQKVYIRNSHRYESCLLFEVNAHSLFSKWFSESGKLVQKLFQHIGEVAEDASCLVILLIDEVESIANARSSAASSGEPGDAVRVVNAVLTALDGLKRRTNVLVLCTSNMVGSLDEAFLDRLDLKVLLGNPCRTARHHILCSCIAELEQRGLIKEDCSDGLDRLSIHMSLMDSLLDATEGMSGRALRRLPLQAHAELHCKAGITVREFIQAMQAVKG